MKSFKVFEPHLDGWQLIAHGPKKDGGDTCANVFTALYCGLGDDSDLSRSLFSLVVNGIPRRHPDPVKWYCATNRTSRDQLTPYLAWAAKPGRINKRFFTKLLLNHAKHAFLFAWNTRRNFQYPTHEQHLRLSTPDVQWNYSWKLPDICGPDIWSIYARGLVQHHPLLALLLPVIPLVVLGDAQNLLAVCFIGLRHKMGKKFGPKAAGGLNHDCRNLTLKVHYAATNFPLPLSWIAWKLWKPLANEAALSFWSQPSEPPMHLAISLLE